MAFGLVKKNRFHFKKFIMSQIGHQRRLDMFPLKRSHGLSLRYRPNKQHINAYLKKSHAFKIGILYFIRRLSWVTRGRPSTFAWATSIRKLLQYFPVIHQNHQKFLFCPAERLDGAVYSFVHTAQALPQVCLLFR